MALVTLVMVGVVAVGEFDQYHVAFIASKEASAAAPVCRRLCRMVADAETADFFGVRLQRLLCRFVYGGQGVAFVHVMFMWSPTWKNWVPFWLGSFTRSCQPLREV
jgi:hypothetical protein